MIDTCKLFIDIVASLDGRQRSISSLYFLHKYQNHPQKLCIDMIIKLIVQLFLQLKLLCLF